MNPRRTVGIAPVLRGRRSLLPAMAAGFAVLAAGWLPAAVASQHTTPEQRLQAQRVAQGGVPLSELAGNAPSSYTIKPGDTLWGLSTLFLKNPWRWPELWGMNLEQVRNPHRIYPGQVLTLTKTQSLATLQIAPAPAAAEEPLRTVKLTPSIRTSPVEDQPIATIPIHLIAPFLNEAEVFGTLELEDAPRIVGGPDQRTLLGAGDVAYVRGELGDARRYHLFREPRPLTDPKTGEVLGYEASFVGAADVVRGAAAGPVVDGRASIVPATVRIRDLRMEAVAGDRLVRPRQTDFSPFVPHAPATGVEGQIISIYGGGLNAGQNQIVALNRGRADGVARGHVLATWNAGRTELDRTERMPEWGFSRPTRTTLQYPDERHGQLIVFRVFDRVSYGLVLNAREPLQRGDRFSRP
jgi:LysM repeat protein